MLDRQQPTFGPLDPWSKASPSADAAFEERLQFAVDVSDGLHDVDLTGRLEDVACQQDVWFGDRFGLIQGEFDGLRHIRDTRRHKYSDVLVIEATTEGLWRDFASKTAEFSTLSVHTTNEDSDIETEAVGFRSLYIPFDIIGYDPSRHHASYDLSLGLPTAHLINLALADVIARMPLAPSQEVPFMIDQLADLVRDLVLQNRKEVDRANINRARRLAINAYIDAHILDTSLTAVTLAHAFAISRATLYRMFEPDGGVDGYIRKRRLHRALVTLKNAAPRRGTVRRVSELHGFLDAGNFNRAFRQEFGFRPSEVLGLGPGVLETVDPPEPRTSPASARRA